MKRINILLIFASVILLVLTISCQSGRCVTGSDVEITFKFNDQALAELEHQIEMGTRGAGLNSEAREVRYTIEIYNILDVDGTTPIARQIYFADKVEDGKVVASFKLDKKDNYKALAWVDFVKPDHNDLYFKTSDLRKIETKEISTSSDNSKKAFSGVTEINLSAVAMDKSVKKTITMHRPMGKIKIVASDIQEYLASSGGIVPKYIQYTLYETYYTEYNVNSDLVSGAVASRVFEGQITDISGAESILAYEWLLTSTTRSVIKLMINIYDSNNNEINAIGIIKDVPIERDKVTILRGALLTGKFEGGGISIDDEFDDEIIIEL